MKEYYNQGYGVTFVKISALFPFFTMIFFQQPLTVMSESWAQDYLKEIPVLQQSSNSYSKAEALKLHGESTHT